MYSESNWQDRVESAMAVTTGATREQLQEILNIVHKLPKDLRSPIINRVIWPHHLRPGSELAEEVASLVRRLKYHTRPIFRALSTVEGQELHQRLADEPHQFVLLLEEGYSVLLRYIYPLGFDEKRVSLREYTEYRRKQASRLKDAIQKLSEVKRIIGGRDERLIDRSIQKALSGELKAILTMHGALDAVSKKLNVRLERLEEDIRNDDLIASAQASRKLNDDRQNFLRAYLSRLQRRNFPIHNNLEGVIYTAARVVAEDYHMEPHHVVQAWKTLRRYRALRSDRFRVISNTNL
ncbi:hypothetical protein A5904_10030 [Acidithiobacillus caldus]|uniref:hypothetical protein n=1 Tax=Acidithiobacillus caldus TaxID=33059 RepID=UPI0005A1E503|nr:hypothetical protein [Acidithiobacillus caldus]AUW33190.2 hypothetical protein A5904_10030 [Acidithiobacillus caldus]MBU2801532.1 hypothetical protein [Acidithiobacillus caldus]